MCQPRVGHGAGGNIKGRGNDSWGPIIRFGSRRDASEAIYLPLPLLISCDVPPSLDSFPFAFLLASREAATFLHNVRTCSFFLSDRNDTANVSVKNSNGTREREGGLDQEAYLLSKGRGSLSRLPATDSSSRSALLSAYPRDSPRHPRTKRAKPVIRVMKPLDRDTRGQKCPRESKVEGLANDRGDSLFCQFSSLPPPPLSLFFFESFFIRDPTRSEIFQSWRRSRISTLQYLQG